MATHANVHRVGLQNRQLGTSTISPVVETIMRLGYIVRGLIYAVIGVLAVQVAVVGRGTIADSQGAIVTMSKTPLGNILLYVILVGLVGYAFWGLVRGMFDALHRGTSPKGLAQRAGYLISAGSYAFLALATYRLIVGASSAAHNGAQTTQTQQAAASILSNPWGVWVVGLAAVVLVGAGLAQIVYAVTHNFNEQFNPYTLTASQRKWIERLGRFGTAARGLVFTLIGVFLFLAAYHHDPHEAQGIDGVLTALLHQTYGTILLGVVALGLIAFGVYSAISGFWFRYRR